MLNPRSTIRVAASARILSRPPEVSVDIDFVVEDGLGSAWDEARLSLLVERIVAGHGAAGGDYALGLHLLSDQTIRALNAEHRGIDAPTDVLSFPLAGELPFVLPPDERIHLGDVIISHPRAVAQAAEFGHSAE